MGNLIVQAHPIEESFNAALLDAVISRLDVSAYELKRLGQGDTLTLSCFDGITSVTMVYPTWWGSPPAMLLAQLERVIGPWVDGAEPAHTSPLRSVQRLTAVTSHGSSRFVNRLQGEPGLQLWKHAVLPLCERGAQFEWKSLYKMDRISNDDRHAFLTQI